MLALLVVWTLFDVYVSARPASRADARPDPAMHVFRGVGCLLLMFWLWAGSAHVWSEARVNYIYIMGLDADALRTPGELVLAAAQFSFAYFFCVLLYVKAAKGQLSLPRGVGPAARPPCEGGDPKKAAVFPAPWLRRRHFPAPWLRRRHFQRAGPP